MTLHAKIRLGAVCVAAASLLAACGSTPSSTGSSTTTGSRPAVQTILVGGLGTASLFTAAGTGAQAYFNQVNASGVLKGIKIKYIGFTDDGGTPASALSAVRQLTTQSHVFAIVPDMSQFNPGTYLASQGVPYVGYGLDSTYCSNTPSTSIWGFGFDGCLVPNNPPIVADSLSPLFKLATAKTGAANPTFLAFSADTQSGQSAATLNSVSATGAGFKVVYSKGVLPVTVSDYTPYVAQWMVANGGKPPQVIECLLTTQCVNAWQALKAVGYTGIFYDNLGGIAALQSSMAGTITANFYNSSPNPGLTQMQNAMNAISPNTALVGYSNVPGYFGASMFVQAVEKVGNNDTPQAVQKALATQTWQIPGLVGPTKYPASTVVASPACQELLQDNANGSGYTIVAPYSCSYKTFKV
ncbi:MAG TPA: ABC transporter substrate-binding protein [Acidimicrobiales bacterium]|jgi:ABC-type branched-subunit amino acid transport system substrate-binding protein|nr:ABC transporter substrate-binding protein [Acidimicrobiales bacterium]